MEKGCETWTSEMPSNFVCKKLTSIQSLITCFTPPEGDGGHFDDLPMY